MRAPTRVSPAPTVSTARTLRAAWRWQPAASATPGPRRPETAAPTKGHAGAAPGPGPRGWLARGQQGGGFQCVHHQQVHKRQQAHGLGPEGRGIEHRARAGGPRPLEGARDAGWRQLLLGHQVLHARQRRASTWSTGSVPLEPGDGDDLVLAILGTHHDQGNAGRLVLWLGDQVRGHAFTRELGHERGPALTQAHTRTKATLAPSRAAATAWLAPCRRWGGEGLAAQGLTGPGSRGHARSDRG